jgi:predicted GNAT family N-acyltransferase
MNKNLQPELLTDKTRLQEIYDLRVTAYENSQKSLYVNRQTFPNGWSDHLDHREQTYHFIIQDRNRIVASARLAIIDDLQEIKDLDEALGNFDIPQVRPFAYYSRLVVHQDYRKLGFVNILDEVRMIFLRKHSDIHFAIAWATPDRHEALLSYGFTHLGNFNYKFVGNYNQYQGIFLLPLSKQV